MGQAGGAEHQRDQVEGADDQRQGRRHGTELRLAEANRKAVLQPGDAAAGGVKSFAECVR